MRVGTGRDRRRGTYDRATKWARAFASIGALACGDADDAEPDDASTRRDSGVVADASARDAVTTMDSGLMESGLTVDCDAAWTAFQTFLEAHRACTADDECTVVGDCGPYAEFEPVRVDAASEARALQLETCPNADDGPLFEGACEAGRCELRWSGAICGLDAGSDDDAGS